MVQGFKVNKILAVSDVVDPALYPAFADARLQDVELVFSCGDLPPEYLAFLARATRAPLYYVLGNHDIRFQTKQPQGCFNLHARLVSFKGLTILGLEGSMWYNGGAHQYTENEMRRVIRRLRSSIWWRGGIDLVISHAPPRGIHDEEDLCHQGFQCFRWLIKKYKPRYFIHGHIHKIFNDPAERVSLVDKTRVINTYGHYVLEIENREPARQTEEVLQTGL